MYVCASLSRRVCDIIPWSCSIVSVGMGFLYGGVYTIYHTGFLYIHVTHTMSRLVCIYMYNDHRCVYTCIYEQA